MEGTVSIIIPAYNVESYIGRCLESVLNQTYENIEVIVIDDGSTDNTFKICKSFLETYSSKMKLVHQENCGQPAATRKGLEMALGEYVLFIDSDDWIEKDMVEIMLGELVDEQVDIVQCRASEDFSDGKGKSEIIPQFTEKAVVDNIKAIESMNYGEIITASKWNKMYRKNLIDTSFFCDNTVTIGEDYRFNVEILCSIKRISVIPDVLYHYCLRSSNMSYRGYTGNGYSIIENYTIAKNKIVKKYPQIYRSATAYWTLQEMAVIISMVKANLYDKSVIRKVQGDLKGGFREYCRDKKVPVHLKICCLLSVVNPWVLIFIYKHLFRKYYAIK